MTDLSAYLDAVQGRAEALRAATHNPWSFNCGKRVDGEPYRDGERCPVCEQGHSAGGVAVDSLAMVAVLREIERLCDSHSWGEDDPLALRDDLRAALSSLTPDTPRGE